MTDSPFGSRRERSTTYGPPTATGIFADFFVRSRRKQRPGPLRPASGIATCPLSCAAQQGSSAAPCGPPPSPHPRSPSQRSAPADCVHSQFPSTARSAMRQISAVYNDLSLPPRQSDLMTVHHSARTHGPYTDRGEADKARSWPWIRNTPSVVPVDSDDHS